MKTNTNHGRRTPHIILFVLLVMSVLFAMAGTGIVIIGLVTGFFFGAFWQYLIDHDEQ